MLIIFLRPSTIPVFPRNLHIKVGRKSRLTESTIFKSTLKSARLNYMYLHKNKPTLKGIFGRKLLPWSYFCIYEYSFQHDDFSFKRLTVSNRLNEKLLRGKFSQHERKKFLYNLRILTF